MRRYRQGDVALYQISKLPKKLKRKKILTIAVGEATGHHHSFALGSKVDIYTDGNKQYLQVWEDSLLQHQEHHEQIILPGTYKQVQEREYSYIDETLRSVID